MKVFEVLAHGPESVHDLVARGRVPLGPGPDETEAPGQHHGPVRRREIRVQARAFQKASHGPDDAQELQLFAALEDDGAVALLAP